MKVTHFLDPFPLITIENTFTEEELKLIWEELDFLCHPSKLKSPEETGTAVDEDEHSSPMKKNGGLWMDQLYGDRNISNLLRVNRTIFLEEHSQEIFRNHPHWFWKNFNPNYDETLLSYYEDGDEYLPHWDTAYATALHWFYKEPKRFEGGSLTFTEYKLNIECKNNCSVIFPSTMYHQVHPVKIEEEYRNQKNGRFCMTQFLSFR